MAELPFHVAIIFLMISGCICPKGMNVDWSPENDEKLLNIFYKIEPRDEYINERVKQMWDEEVPQYNFASEDTLKRHIYKVRLRYWNDWLEHPGPEREEMEKTLVDIYGKTQGERSGHERRMLKMLLQRRPQYSKEYEMYRNIVYRWYEKYAPLGRVIKPGDVDWTPQRLANLLHIVDQARSQGHHLYQNVEDRWSKMYEYLNVDVKFLVGYADNLRRRQGYEPADREKLIAEQKYQELFHSETELEREKAEKQVYWTRRMKAYLSYIYHQLPYTDIDLAAALKDRWDRMRPEHTPLGKDFLLAQAKDLESARYKPKPEHIKEATDMYKNLPPIPHEILFGRAGGRVSKQLHIPETREHNQQHQDKPASPRIDFTPGLVAHLHGHMAGMGSPHARHAYYPYQTGYHDSSSHTPVERGPTAPLQDVRHQEHHHSYTGGSRSPTPIHDDIFSSLPDILHEHPDFWNLDGSSRHTSIQPETYGSLPITPHPEHYFWNASGSNEYTSIYYNQTDSYADTPRPGHRRRRQGGSSSHTTVDQGQFSSLPGTRRSPQHCSHPGGSSTYICNQLEPPGPLLDTPHPHHFPWNPSGSSDYTPIHHNQTGSYVDTPRPPRRQRHQGSSSSHPRNPPQE